MLTSPPRRKIYAFVAILVTSVLCSPCVAISEEADVATSEDAEVSAQQTRGGVNRQLQRMRLSLARIRRKVDALTTTNTAVKNGISDVKSSLVTLNQRGITGNTTAPSTPSQNVIGSNKSSTTYMTFDFYPGIRPEAVVQHRGGGVLLSFRTYEGSKVVQEYKLDFPFEGRSEDQKSADAMMISVCLHNFHRAADAPNGGSFYIHPSADDKLGLLCSSLINR